MAKVMLGELLVSAGLVSEEQVIAAVRAQRGSGLPLGHFLVKTGILREDVLVRVLSQQLEIPIVDLDAAALNEDALTKISADVARGTLIVPYRLEGRVLLVATADPTREEVLDDLRVATNCDVRFRLATPSAIDRALDRAFGNRAAGGDVALAARAHDSGPATRGASGAAPVPPGLEERLARIEAAVRAVVDLLVGQELARKNDFPQI